MVFSDLSDNIRLRGSGIPLPLLLTVDPGATVDIMAWACWAVPLLIAEPFLQLYSVRKENAVGAGVVKSA